MRGTEPTEHEGGRASRQYLFLHRCRLGTPPVLTRRTEPGSLRPPRRAGGSWVVTRTPGIEAHRAYHADERNYDVFTVRSGRIVALRACRSRAEAAALAGVESRDRAPLGRRWARERDFPLRNIDVM
jgi:hypothetical protein